MFIDNYTGISRLWGWVIIIYVRNVPKFFADEQSGDQVRLNGLSRVQATSSNEIDMVLLVVALRRV